MPARSRRDDRDVELGMDLGMQTNAHRVRTDGLDRVFELDPAAIDGMPLPCQCVSDVLRGNGTEQLTLLASLPAERQGHRAQGASHTFGLGALRLIANCAYSGLLGDPFPVALSLLIRQPLMKQ